MKQCRIDQKCDLFRLTGSTNSSVFKYLLLNKTYRLTYCFRAINGSGRVSRLIARIFWKIICKHGAVELPRTAKVGKGILFLHPYGITINSEAVVGDNLTMLKGSTIGNSKTGKVGAPTVGNNVYIGLNSTVVGKITVGDDVMIAANTFVNFDVPDGALVIGSPGVIHQREHSSWPYITNRVDEEIAAEIERRC